jgi:hypothetical protein
MSDEYVHVWEIPIGSAWIRVTLSAPNDGKKHSGKRLTAQGRAIASLGRAITKIRAEFDSDDVIAEQKKP